MCILSFVNRVRYFLCNLCVGALCGNPLCVTLSFFVGVSGEETSFLLLSDETKKDVSIFLLSFSFFLLSLLSFLDSRSLSVDVSRVSSDGGPGTSFGGFVPPRWGRSPPPWWGCSPPHRYRWEGLPPPGRCSLVVY